MFFQKRLKDRLLFSYFLVVLFSFGLVAYFLDKDLEGNFLQEIKTSLVHQGYLIEAQLTSELFQESNLSVLQAFIGKLGSKIGSRVTVVDKIGRVLADSSKSPAEISKLENHAERPEIKSSLKGGIGENVHYSFTLKIDMMYVAVPLKDNNGIIGAVRLAVPLVSVQKTLAVIRRTVLVAFMCALAAALIIGLVLTGNITRPINKMIQVSRKFSQGDFSRRILHETPDELGELARALNSMAQDVEGKIKEVKTQNQHLSAIFNSMVEGVIVLDRQARVVSINPTIEKIFGIAKKEAEGRLLLEAIRNNEIAELVERVLKGGTFAQEQIVISWPVQRIFQVHASAVFENDKVSGCLVVVHDITEIRKLETVRRDFVANAAHELKTPLTSIRGFVETLLEGALDDKAHSRQFLHIIHDHAMRLDNLINDLLTLSYLESREVEKEFEKIKLRELAEKVLSGFSAQLAKKGIKAINEVPVHASINADRHKLEQVLTNLIDNAIKFNQDKGSIRVYTYDSESEIKVIIEDSGIGIPAKDIPRIFERFYRVDKTRSRELGGTGLGLSIVKHIIELHAGHVGVESIEGLGSKFWFTIPK